MPLAVLGTTPPGAVFGAVYVPTYTKRDGADWPSSWLSSSPPSSALATAGTTRAASAAAPTSGNTSRRRSECASTGAGCDGVTHILPRFESPLIHPALHSND